MKITAFENQCSCLTAEGYDDPFFFENGSDVIQLANISAPGIVLICGGSGIGKTHLLKMLAANYNNKHPGQNVKITSSSDLANEIFDSVSKGTYLNLLEEKARAGILLIDDVDSPSVRYIQKELIRVINAVYQHGGLCVISCHYFEKWILDSFKCPVIVRLWREGHFVRFLCGCERAKQKGLTIPPEAIMKISKKTNSMTALFGMMLRYDFEAELG